jgi:hypothetical protein
VHTDLDESASDGNGSSEGDAPLVGLPPDERYACPVCDGTLYVNWRVGRWTRRPEPFYYCFSCANHYGNATYNAELRARGVWPNRLKRGDFSQLGRPLGRASRNGLVEPPPTEAAVDGWRAALLASPDALRYLLGERGLTVETVEQYELGYEHDRHAVTIPIRDEGGALVNLKRRRLDPAARPKIVGLARPAVVYPLGVLADEPEAVVLCEGELDCLLLNQHGIPALTGTAGTTWKGEWAVYLVGRRVAVMYDAGSYELATRRAAGIVGAGAREAWPVDLTRAGLDHGEDVGDWFVRYGRTADELRRFINDSRRWYRRRA